MASENEGWDTSTAFIRRTLKACIEHGRNAGGQENSDLFEAFRLLGTGLHTLEDLLAHSNWCEIALRKMGHEEVFCHVGDNGGLPPRRFATLVTNFFLVIVETPSGPAPPLVTGTFGGELSMFVIPSSAILNLHRRRFFTFLARRSRRVSSGMISITRRTIPHVFTAN